MVLYAGQLTSGEDSNTGSSATIVNYVFLHEH